MSIARFLPEMAIPSFLRRPDWMQRLVLEFWSSKAASSAHQDLKLVFSKLRKRGAVLRGANIGISHREADTVYPRLFRRACHREYTVSLKSRYLLALLGGFHPPTGGAGRGLGPVAPGGGGGTIGGGGGLAPDTPIGGGGGGGMPPCMAGSGGGGGGDGIAASVIDTSDGSRGGGGGIPHVFSIGVGGGGGGGIPLMMLFMGPWML